MTRTIITTFAALLFASGCGDDRDMKGTAGPLTAGYDDTGYGDGTDGGGVDDGGVDDGGSADGGSADGGSADGGTGDDGGGSADDGGTATAGDDGGTATGGDDGGMDTGGGGPLDPPAGESSGGSGGPSGGSVTTPDGVSFNVVTPGGGGPHPLMIVFSGTEGGSTMTSNLQQLRSIVGLNSVLFAVIDGPSTFGNGQAGVSVLDHVRSLYDIDNDRTYLLGESAGTMAALELGLQLRQSYFAAYWANDVNAQAQPSLSAADLGFAPYGNAGPGGDFPDANAIVSGMMAAVYRTPPPAPYDGPGAGSHGDQNQFMAALQWFGGKTRQ